MSDSVHTAVAMEKFADFLSFLLVLQYCRVYRRNTYSPLMAIIQAQTELSLRKELERWSNFKLLEAQYVSVAVCNFPTQFLNSDP